MEGNPLVEIGLPVVLAVIMVGIGLTLTTADFMREREAPRAAVVGTAAQLVAMPVVALGIAWALSPGPAVAVGLVVAAACPGGSTSNLIAYLARGNVALSIVLTVISSVAIIVTLPLWAGLALDLHPLGVDVGEVRVPIADTAGILLGVVLLPVAAGMAIRRHRPALAARIERFVGALGAVVLVALVVGIAVSVRDQLVDLIATAGPATLLLALAGVAIGVGAGALTGVAAADRLTLAIELALKNTTLGLLITLNVMGSEAVSFTTAVYGAVMYLPAAALVVVGRRRAAAATPVPARP